MRDLGRLGIVALLALALVGCSGASHGGHATGPTTTTVAFSLPTTSSTTEPSPHPPASHEGPASLALTPTAGGPGTMVSLVAARCPAPASGGEAFFADSAALRNSSDPSLRHAVTVLGASAGTVRATYTVREGDTRGYGIFEVLCGTNGNATAGFTVTR